MKYVFVIFIAFGLSCSSSKNQAPETIVEEKEQEEKPVANKAVYEVLQYRTTQCFGKCPVYSIIYYSNGQIAYEGKDNIKPLGRYVRTLSKVEQADMRKLIDYAELDDAKEDYDPYIVDAPVTHLTYTIPGEEPYHTKGVLSWPDNITKLINHLKTEYKEPDTSWTKANIARPSSALQKSN